MTTRRSVVVVVAVLVAVAVARVVAQTSVGVFDRIYLGTTFCAVRTGSGTPQSVVTGNRCDYYIDTATSNLYRKQSGTATNTGWEIVPMSSLATTWTAAQTFTAGIRSDTWVTQSTGWIVDTGGNAQFNGSMFSPAVTGTTVTASTARSPTWVSNTTGWLVDSGGNAQFNGSMYSPGITAGTLSLTTALPCTSGGTGRNSWTVGGLVFAMGGCSLGPLAPVAVGQVLVSNGTGSGPLWSGNPTLASATSTSWVGRTTGWIIDAGGNAEFNSTIYAPEMHVRTFVAEQERALAGSEIITTSVAVLQAPFTMVALGTAGTIRVEYLAGAPNMRAFNTGDSVVLRTYTRPQGGLVVADAVGVVTSPDTTNAAYQQWTWTRNSGANGGTMAAGAVVPAQTAALDYGVSGNGVYEINAVQPTLTVTLTNGGDVQATGTTPGPHGFTNGASIVISGAAQTNYNGTFTITSVPTATTFTYNMPGLATSPATCASPCTVTASGTNQPYAQVLTWTTAPTTANQTVRCRWGNVRGLTGTLEYGMLCGDYTNKKYIRLTSVNAEIVGLPFDLYDGATKTLSLVPTVPSFAIGNPLPSAFGTGAGIWMGKDAGVYKFRAGDPATNRLEYDGSNLKLVSANLTIDNASVRLVPNTAASYNVANGYNFTASTGLLGVAGYDNAGSTARSLYLTASYTGAGNYNASINLLAQGNSGATRNAYINLLSAPGSSTSTISMLSKTATWQLDTLQFTGLTTNAVISAGGEFNASDGTNTVRMGSTFIGTGTATNLSLVANNGTIMTLTAGGGARVGAPTGGDKGTGTLNAVALYSNGTINTDWVFELAYAGSSKAPHQDRLYSLADTDRVTRTEFRLPWMPTQDAFEREREMGGMTRRLWQGQEQQQLYISDLNARIAALERKAGRQ